MPILTTIHRADGIDVHGKTVSRTAVRGVILRGRDLLMIHSATVGDYKFPGGGVNEGESHAQALAREIQEECGAVLTHIGREIGAVVEYNFAVEDEFDTFKMTSHYYLCGVQDDLGPQHLDDYERDLGFEPVWMPIDEALRSNRSLLESTSPPEWLRREIFMLEYLQHANL
jgi:8-oxo-dGTP pyrophosphatase MutT (NUDIX family)